MKVPFLKPGNFKYKKTEIKENLMDLIKTMGLKPSEDNLKIFRTYLGIENGRKPLENETFKDYYKRTLKLFLKDMQKEAKRKVEEEGKKPVVNGQDVINKFDNLMNSIVELHNDEIDKKEKKEAGDPKKGSDTPTPNKKDNKYVESTIEPTDELPNVKVLPSKPQAPAASAGGNDGGNNRTPLFAPSGYSDGRYGWHQFDEEDIHAKDKVEEYMRRVRTFQRIFVERYVCYDPLYASSIVNSFFKIPVYDSSSWWYDLAPDLSKAVAKEEMRPSFNVEIDKKGNIKDKDKFLDVCKKEVVDYVKKTAPRGSRSLPSNEVIDDAYGIVYDVCMDIIPKEKKNADQLGLTDSQYEDLITETQFDFAVESVKELFGGKAIDRFDMIEVKDSDKGENNSKALIAVSFYRGIKTIMSDKNLVYKAAHKADYSILKQMEKFLIDKVGLSKEFIKEKSDDEGLFNEIKEQIKVEYEAKKKHSKAVVKKDDVVVDSKSVNGVAPKKEKVVENKDLVQDVKQQEPMLLGPNFNSSKNNKKNN